MRLVGITGSMGSGKTTSAKLLVELGATVLSADELARKAVEPGESAYREIVAHFGRKILRNDLTIDRRRLADIVFSDSKQRSRLNRITHPQVYRLQEARLRAIYRQKPESLVVCEIPLLFENNLQSRFQKVIAVWIDREVRWNRLMASGRFSERDVKKRLNVQMDQEEKVFRADYVIDNSGSLENLREQLQRIHAKLLRLPQITPAAVL